MKGKRLRLLIILLALVAAIWVVPLFLSVESGLKFGWPFRIFFTLIALLGSLLFYLLGVPAMSPMKSAAGAFGGVALVFLVSIGAIVLLANVAPQFASEETSARGATAEERGRALFNDPKVGCFLCHTIGGFGGTRGPNLSRVASVAEERRLGMSAEDYVRESLLDPAAYVVPTYDNIMPSQIAQRLSSAQFSDLLSYLLSFR